ncbi:MAG: carbon-nitrogen hydrolase family protein [Candidatus Latescibacterota bacterium]|nr:carbon-nitrogen hydrolase family protein [Candidatus Latescibacterota bacterium]
MQIYNEPPSLGKLRRGLYRCRMALLRVAACQLLTSPDPSVSVVAVLEWMENARETGCDVVAFPEACLCGYAAGDDYWRQAQPVPFLEAEQRVQEAARKLHLAVVLGTVHWEDGEGPFNSLLAVDRDGLVRGRYSKIHLAESWPLPGRSLPVYELASVASCFLVCHDIRYPELVRLPAAVGARICYYCSNESGLLSEQKLSAYRAMPISRATENSIFLIMANAPANAHDLHSSSQSHGNSMIVHPDGRVLAEAGHFTEQLVVADIELSEATGQLARRAVDDDTILHDWMRAGVRLVQNGDQGDDRS